MSQPLRVLHIVTYMGRGGLETMIMNYYRNIDRSKVQFDFLVHRDFKADYDDEIESLGGRIYRISQLNPFSISYYKELNKFFSENRYKIVHCHLDCMSAIPLSVAKKFNIPVRIAHSHTSYQDKNFKFIIKAFAKNFIHKYATKLFACSEIAGKWMFGNHNYEIFNNAIDTKKYIYNQNIQSKVKSQFNLNNNFIIGHVGRFNPPKNHNFLIDIFFEVYKKDNTAKLVLVGSGDLQKNIENKVKNYGITNNVLFLGSRDDVHEILQAFDVFVFPSLYEGFPVTSVEAQAAGLSAVLSDAITKECKINDNVKFLSLNDAPKKWADEILKFKDYRKVSCSEKILKAGYDIIEKSKWLENYYLEMDNYNE
ncbi:MAG: glycosyltransferase family 1 protein [Clostridia bacterium]|nr:glycosyltransferase family 1 protein [Clostridia bacterium]